MEKKVLAIVAVVVLSVIISASADTPFKKDKSFLARHYTGKRCTMCVCPSGYPASGCCCPHGSSGHCSPCVCPSGYGSCCC